MTVAPPGLKKRNRIRIPRSLAQERAYTHPTRPLRAPGKGAEAFFASTGNGLERHLTRKGPGPGRLARPWHLASQLRFTELFGGMLPIPLLAHPKDVFVLAKAGHHLWTLRHKNPDCATRKPLGGRRKQIGCVKYSNCRAQSIQHCPGYLGCVRFRYQ